MKEGFEIKYLTWRKRRNKSGEKLGKMDLPANNCAAPGMTYSN